MGEWICMRLKPKEKINLAISWLKPTAMDKNLNIFTSGK
jgi:hypothetical protein